MHGVSKNQLTSHLYWLMALLALKARLFEQLYWIKYYREANTGGTQATPVVSRLGGDSDKSGEMEQLDQWRQREHYVLEVEQTETQNGRPGKGFGGAKELDRTKNLHRQRCLALVQAVSQSCAKVG